MKRFSLVTFSIAPFCGGLSPRKPDVKARNSEAQSLKSCGRFGTFVGLSPITLSALAVVFASISPLPCQGGSRFQMGSLEVDGVPPDASLQFQYSMAAYVTSRQQLKRGPNLTHGGVRNETEE